MARRRTRTGRSAPTGKLSLAVRELLPFDQVFRRIMLSRMMAL